MAFVIKNIIGTGVSTEKIGAELEKILTKSRFTALVEISGDKVKIRNVRLKQNKDYCGNHPFTCPIRPWGNEKHKKLNYLEGADWVAFNDMVNDVLDDLGVSADVASSLVVIRKGEKRCVNYGGHLLSNKIDNEWNKEGEKYENWIGKKAERSKFPIGTPGIPAYLI